MSRHRGPTADTTQPVPVGPRWIRPGNRAHRHGETLTDFAKTALVTCGVADAALTALIYAGVRTVYSVPLSAFVWAVWRGVAIATVLMLIGWALTTGGRP